MERQDFRGTLTSPSFGPCPANSLIWQNGRFSHSRSHITLTYNFTDLRKSWRNKELAVYSSIPVGILVAGMTESLPSGRIVPNRLDNVISLTLF